MSNASNIEWTQATWNPVVGCTRASAGCDHCYAVAMTNRLEAMGQSKYAGLTVLNPKGDRHFNGVVRTVPEDLGIPLRWKKPRTVFVNSMSDLFHRDIPAEYIWLTFAVMASCPQHTFQVLTKRADRMAQITGNANGASFALGVLRQAHKIPGQQGISGGWSNPIPNVWLGTSVENKVALWRIDELRMCKAAIRFLSCEPLLEDLGELNLEGIHWVIVGGESGGSKKSPARECSIEWIRNIVRQCEAASVPCFVKQIGSHPTCHYGVSDKVERGQMFATSAAVVRDALDLTPMKFAGWTINDRKGGNPDEWPEDLRVRQMPAESAALAGLAAARKI